MGGGAGSLGLARSALALAGRGRCDHPSNGRGTQTPPHAPTRVSQVQICVSGTVMPEGRRALSMRAPSLCPSYFTITRCPENVYSSVFSCCFHIPHTGCRHGTRPRDQAPGRQAPAWHRLPVLPSGDKPMKSFHNFGCAPRHGPCSLPLCPGCPSRTGPAGHRLSLSLAAMKQTLSFPASVVLSCVCMRPHHAHHPKPPR